MQLSSRQQNMSDRCLFEGTKQDMEDKMDRAAAGLSKSTNISRQPSSFISTRSIHSVSSTKVTPDRNVRRESMRGEQHKELSFTSSSSEHARNSPTSLTAEHEQRANNLGLFYGMGKNKLQAELGISKDKSDGLFRQYHNKVPFVKQLMDNVMQRAQNSGKVRTLLGRLCRFHLWEPNQFGIHKALPHDAALLEHGPGIKRAFTYKALNKLIQGSAADMTKKAMIELYKEGIIPHIQVHDELDISVESSEHANKIVEIMENAVNLEVPNKVDYESGPNWGQIK